jgi:hypothetical protein
VELTYDFLARGPADRAMDRLAYERIMRRCPQCGCRLDAALSRCRPGCCAFNRDRRFAWDVPAYHQDFDDAWTLLRIVCGRGDAARARFFAVLTAVLAHRLARVGKVNWPEALAFLLPADVLRAALIVNEGL